MSCLVILKIKMILFSKMLIKQIFLQFDKSHKYTKSSINLLHHDPNVIYETCPISNKFTLT